MTIPLPAGSGAGPAELIAGLFAGAGARDYLGEPVTVAVHMLQAAALAAAAAAPPELVAAALLHDVGHLSEEFRWTAPGHRGQQPLSGHHLMAGRDNRHGAAGAAWLSQWFPAGVTEPVRLHVDAKRYLCATVPGYAGRLSAASAYTLTVQGGPMTPAEVTAFEALPHAQDAVAVRGWDDEAKDPGGPAPAFGRFRPLLGSLVRS
jgi:gamma-butyrobetaine dioxygenase